MKTLNHEIREYANGNNTRTFSIEYMEMRSRENQTNLGEYYRGLNEYIQSHRSTEIQDKNKSNYDDYRRRQMKSWEIQASR